MIVDTKKCLLSFFMLCLCMVGLYQIYPDGNQWKDLEYLDMWENKKSPGTEGSEHNRYSNILNREFYAKSYK